MNKTKQSEQKVGSPSLISFDELFEMMSSFSPSDFDNEKTARAAKKRFEDRFGFLAFVALMGTLEEAMQLLLPLSQLKVVAEKQGIKMIGKHQTTYEDFQKNLEDFQAQVYGEVIDDSFMRETSEAKIVEEMVGMKTEGGVQ